MPVKSLRLNITTSGGSEPFTDVTLLAITFFIIYLLLIKKIYKDNLIKKIILNLEPIQREHLNLEKIPNITKYKFVLLKFILYVSLLKPL